MINIFLKRLNFSTSRVMKGNLIQFNYNRKKVKPGILHFSVGNFHRAHLAFYNNFLLEKPGNEGWGICGCMFFPFDEARYKGMKAQDGMYTLTVCGRDGVDKAYCVGSIVEVLWAVENPKAIIEKMANKDIKIITLTITEGGYFQNNKTGEFELNNADIQHDLKNPSTPKTTFGFMAEGLRHRMKSGAGPVTILSCDNLQHNGSTAKRTLGAFFKAQDPELAAWVEKNVTFPNSMVDRITPATTPADIERLNKQNGSDDRAPVYAEDYIEWVIEDNFVAGRPDWDQYENVQFCKDVTLFENMKISLLNASHQMLSYPSFLHGYRKVDAAMADKRIEKLLRDFMNKDITKYVPQPSPKTDLNIYKQTLIERFANKTVSDQVARLCMDGLSKFPVYIVPNLAKMLADGSDLKRQAFLIASYRHYLHYKKDDNGESYPLVDNCMNPEDEQLFNSEDPVDFLGISAFKAVDLKNHKAFMEIYLRYVKEIKEKKTMPVLESIINE